MGMIMQMIRAATDVAWRVRHEEGALTFENLMPPAEYSDEDVAALVLLADEWRLAAIAVSQVMGEEWVKRWEARGHRGIMLEEVLVTTKYGSTTERCVDPEGFWAWFATADTPARDLFNPNTALKSAMPKAARDTFFVKRRNIKPDAVRQVAVIPRQFLETKENSNDGQED